MPSFVSLLSLIALLFAAQDLREVRAAEVRSPYRVVVDDSVVSDHLGERPALERAVIEMRLCRECLVYVLRPDPSSEGHDVEASAIAAGPAPDARLTRAEAGVQPSGVELPRTFLDTRMPAVTGRTIRVSAGEDLQDAIDAARPGDEILLQAGAEFRGQFRLREKQGDGWIIIRSDAPLPPEGTRLDPARYAGEFARLVSTGAGSALAAIVTDPRASGYRLVGLEITADSSLTGGSGALVFLGNTAATQVSDLPSDIVLDRVYIHGHPALSFQRCVAVNGVAQAVVDSHLSECHGKGFDSQAIVGWAGPGPFKVVNNYLEGAGETVMFGGADPNVQGVVPSDIEVRRNYFYKPPSWRGTWTVKNIFETKNAKRVLVEANVFENVWADAQTGFAILLKATNDGGGCTWCTAEDITFRYNWIENAANGINIGNIGDLTVARFDIHDNVFARLGAHGDFDSGGTLRAFLMVNVCDDIRVRDNTFEVPTGAIYFAGGYPSSGFVFDNNAMPAIDLGYGIGGDGPGGWGTGTLQTYAPGFSFSGNVLSPGIPASAYPRTSYYPASDAWIDLTTYRIVDPTYAGVGADIDAVLEKIQGVKKTVISNQ